MAKFTFYDVKIMKFKPTDNQGNEIKDAKDVILDSVQLQFTKKVSNSTMRGTKAEFYNVPIVDLPYLLLKPDVKLPAIAGDGNCDARIEAVHKLLAPFLDKSCIVEDVPDKSGRHRVLTYIEFD